MNAWIERGAPAPPRGWHEAALREQPAETGPVGAPHPAAVAPVAVRRNAQNRRALLLALLPLLLVAGSGTVGLARQAIQRRYQMSFAGGNLGRGEASRIAAGMCSRLTGEEAVAVDVTFQTAVSVRRGAAVGEWDVLCRTPRGAHYLLRVNAESRRVYGVNRIDETAQSAAQARGFAPAAALDDASAIPGPDVRVSRKMAEANALRYLSLLGIPKTGLRPLAHGDAPEAIFNSPQYNFTYVREVPGVGKRLLKVSVSSRDGRLHHAWNPSFSR